VVSEQSVDVEQKQPFTDFVWPKINKTDEQILTTGGKDSDI